jgi:hypothetical protein
MTYRLDFGFGSLLKPLRRSLASALFGNGTYLFGQPIRERRRNSSLPSESPDKSGRSQKRLSASNVLTADDRIWSTHPSMENRNARTVLAR